MIHNIPQVMQMITMLEEQDERIAELEELVDMLIDCQSADASLIPMETLNRMRKLLKL